MMIARCTLWLCACAFALRATVGAASETYLPHDGDIVFQTSQSAQSAAIQRATHSVYSHTGVIFLAHGQAYVFEAVQPVQSTPLETWIARGKGGHFVAKRLRANEHVLSNDDVRKLRIERDKLRGKSYDLYFEWSDERMYCSELVWKLYQRALGMELGTKQRLRDFDLADPIVAAKLHERWKHGAPLNEPVISPAAIFASERLETVFER